METLDLWPESLDDALAEILAEQRMALARSVYVPPERRTWSYASSSTPEHPSCRCAPPRPVVVLDDAPYLGAAMISHADLGLMDDGTATAHRCDCRRPAPVRGTKVKGWGSDAMECAGCRGYVTAYRVAQEKIQVREPASDRPAFDLTLHPVVGAKP